MHNIVQKIGFPVKSPDIRNASALEKYYEHVNINSTTFFQNAISIAQFDARRGWSALGKPTDREEWGMTVPTVNVSEQISVIYTPSSKICSLVHSSAVFPLKINDLWDAPSRPITIQLGTKSSFPPE